MKLRLWTVWVNTCDPILMVFTSNSETSTDEDDNSELENSINLMTKKWCEVQN